MSAISGIIYIRGILLPVDGGEQYQLNASIDNVCPKDLKYEVPRKNSSIDAKAP